MNVGIIGLGIIGSRVAENYRNAGHEVAVWNRTRKETAGFRETPRDVAEAADIVQIFVNDGTSLRSVVEDMLPSLRPGKLVINSATVSLEATLETAALVAGTGADFLDCPFTGSRDAAAGAQLVYYAAGDAAAIEKARPLLLKSGKEVLEVGKIGDATIVKITTNLVSATVVQALSEALAVTQAAGVSGEVFHRVMESNANCSPLVRMKLPTMLKGDFTPHFSLKNMLKDSKFALALAKAASLSIPALQATSERMQALTDQGHGDQDYSVLCRQF